MRNIGGQLLMKWLEHLPPDTKQHPAYRTIQKLLGPIFIKSELSARLAVLQSADWLLSVLETLPMT
jgi:hypothetical protein